MLYQKGSFSGDYGGGTAYPEAFVNVIALEFGASCGQGLPGRVNEAIAECLMACNCDAGYGKRRTRFFVSKSIYDALVKLQFRGKVCVVSHGSAGYFGRADMDGLRHDAYEHISAAARLIRADGRDKTCLIVSHANMASRAMKQARKCGLQPYVLRELPSVFDPDSPQVWCRNRFFWIMRELVAQPYLKLIGRL